MAVLQIDDKYLYQPTIAFDFSAPPENPVDLANSLIETMIAYNAIGVAANQVGKQWSVFALRSEQPLVLFNPVITGTMGDDVYMEEGCLSFPNYILRVKRAAEVRVRFYEANGSFRIAHYIGMTARAVLHEYDHLQGMTFHDRATLLHRERADRQYRKRVKKIKENR